MPSLCVCCESFTVDHALICSHVGYLCMLNSEVPHLLGHMLDETCLNVSLEPALQPASGEVLPATAETPQEVRVYIYTERWHESAFFRLGFSTHMYACIVTARCLRCTGRKSRKNVVCKKYTFVISTEERSYHFFF